MQVLCYDTAMGPWLLGCVVLCLLGAGPLEAQVTQTPRYLITKTGKKLTVTCTQNMNQDCMYWYRQDPGLGLKLIYLSINVEIVDKGDIFDGYVVSRKEKKKFPLTLESTSINQTSLYLCASSLSTAQHRQLLSAQKGAATKTRRLLPGEASPKPKQKLPPPQVTIEALPTPQLRGPSAMVNTQGPVLLPRTVQKRFLKVRKDKSLPGVRGDICNPLPCGASSFEYNRAVANEPFHFQSTRHKIWSLDIYVVFMISPHLEDVLKCLLNPVPPS